MRAALFGISNQFAESIINIFSDDIDIDVFTDGEELTEAFMKEHYHLVFLELELPETKVFLLSDRLKTLDGQVYIVFVSGNKELVYEAIKYSPYRFVRKQKLETGIREAYFSAEKLISRNRVICLAVKKENIEIDLKSIIYVEVKGHYVTFITNSLHGNVRVRESMKNIQEMLGAEYFLRVHVAYLVNLMHVRTVGRTELYIDDGIVIPVARAVRKEVAERCRRYLLEK